LATDTRKSIRKIADEAYAEAIRDLTANGKVASIGELHEAVVSAIVEATTRSLDDGGLDAAETMYELAHSAAAQTDKRATDSGKRLLDEVLEGQLSLGDMNDDVVVAIGNGERIRWGNIDMDSLVRIDNDMFINIERAVNRHKKWRGKVFQIFMDFFKDHPGTTESDLRRMGYI